MTANRCLRKLLPSLMLTTLFLLGVSLIPTAQAQIVCTWESDRPKETIEFRDTQRVENASTNDEASVSVAVDIDAYREDSSEGPYYGDDGLALRVSATANTRKGSQYTHFRWGHLVSGFPDTSHMDDTGISGDEDGQWITLPFKFYFYGGGGETIQTPSGYYDEIWVSSNGFISVDNISITAPTPLPIPYDGLPNGLIAVYWKDLDVSGGAIKYSIIGPPNDQVVVVWDNVLNKATGARETFGVIIKPETSPFPLGRGQSKIEFLYKTISGDSNAVIGLEDQEGFRGYTLGFTPTGEDEVWFNARDSSPEIRSVTIRAQKADNNAKIIVSTDHNLLRGYNLRWETTEVDPGSIYEMALMGGATLLSSRIIAIGNPFGGLVWGSMLLSYNMLKAFAREQWPVYYQSYSDAGVSESVAHISSSAAHLTSVDWPVDAVLDDTIYWVFTDQNTVAHSIEFYGEVEYYSYVYSQIRTLQTTVELSMTPDICDNFSSPKRISLGVDYRGSIDTIDLVDTYVVNIPTNPQRIYVSMTPPKDANFDIYLYDPYGALVDSSTRTENSSEYISYNSHQAESADWYVQVKLAFWPGHTNNGIYKLRAYVPSGGGGSGGCPFVSVWNGSEYARDNNVLPRSILNNGVDVEDNYRLEQTPVPVYQNQHYSIQSLMLSEFESEHSYFDQVRLMAVDHNSDVNIAVTPTGQILTYKNPAPPIFSVDQDGNSRLNEISAMDGNVSDPTTYFYGLPGDYLLLNFGQVSADNAKLIFRDDMKKEEDPCINVQVLDANSNWQTVEVLVPRAYWSIEAVNIKPYIVQGHDLWVRLYWSQPHRLDYVGLDTTPQDSYQLQTATLVAAVHSVYGNVKTLLTQNDNIYTELTPNQQIYLAFKLPNNESEKRTFIFYTKGHYTTIP